MAQFFSRDTHATSNNHSHWSTERIAVTALICAVAFITSFIEFPLMPSVAPYLKYDPSGAVALLGGFMFGPVTGLIAVFLPWILHFFITANFYGCLMSILANVCFVLPAVLIVGKTNNQNRVVLGILVGSIATIVAAILGNLVVTPIYTNMPVEAIVGLILPVLLPFNLIKAAINGVVSFICRTPLRHVLKAKN